MRLQGVGPLIQSLLAGGLASECGNVARVQPQRFLETGQGGLVGPRRDESLRFPNQAVGGLGLARGRASGPRCFRLRRSHHRSGHRRRRRRRPARWRRIDEARSHSLRSSRSRGIRDRGGRVVQPLAGIDLGRGTKARHLRALTDRSEDDPPADLDGTVQEHEEWDGREESRDDALLQDEGQERRCALVVPKHEGPRRTVGPHRRFDIQDGSL